MRRQQEIERLRSKLARLEAEQEREEQARQSLEQSHQQLLSTLAESDLGMEDFVRCYYKEIRKLVLKVERGQAKHRPARTGKKAVKKKTARKKSAKRRSPKVQIKIPAGRYGNLPAEPDKVYEVKEKGARPKALKAYAEKVGLENFLKECLLV